MRLFNAPPIQWLIIRHYKRAQIDTRRHRLLDARRLRHSDGCDAILFRSLFFKIFLTRKTFFVLRCATHNERRTRTNFAGQRGKIASERERERKSRQIKAERVAKIFRFARLILASSKEVHLSFHHLFGKNAPLAFNSDQLRRRRGSS